MITSFQNKLLESHDGTIIGNWSLQNRKIYLNAQNFSFKHLITIKRTFLDQDLSNDVPIDSIR